MTNRRRVNDNNNISQLLRDSFSVSQHPPIWEPPSHYSMVLSQHIDKDGLVGRKQPEHDDGSYRVRQQIVVSMLEGHSLLEKELHTLD